MVLGGSGRLLGWECGSAGKDGLGPRGSAHVGAQLSQGQLKPLRTSARASCALSFTFPPSRLSLPPFLLPEANI